MAVLLVLLSLLTTSVRADPPALPSPEAAAQQIAWFLASATKTYTWLLPPPLEDYRTSIAYKNAVAIETAREILVGSPREQQENFQRLLYSELVKLDYFASIGREAKNPHGLPLTLTKPWILTVLTTLAAMPPNPDAAQEMLKQSIEKENPFTFDTNAVLRVLAHTDHRFRPLWNIVAYFFGAPKGMTLWLSILSPTRPKEVSLLLLIHEHGFKNGLKKYAEQSWNQTKWELNQNASFLQQHSLQDMRNILVNMLLQSFGAYNPIRYCAKQLKGDVTAEIPVAEVDPATGQIRIHAEEIRVSQGELLEVEHEIAERMSEPPPSPRTAATFQQWPPMKPTSKTEVSP